MCITIHILWYYPTYFYAISFVLPHYYLVITSLKTTVLQKNLILKIHVVLDFARSENQCFKSTNIC